MVKVNNIFFRLVPSQEGGIFLDGPSSSYCSAHPLRHLLTRLNPVVSFLQVGTHRPKLVYQATEPLGMTLFLENNMQ
jgi:hypothetical protein